MATMLQVIGCLSMGLLRPSLQGKIKVRLVQEFLARDLLEHGWKMGRNRLTREVADRFNVDLDEARDLIDEHYGEVTESAQDWFDKESMSREERILARIKEKEELRLLNAERERKEAERAAAAIAEWERKEAERAAHEALLPKAKTSDTDDNWKPRRPGADYGQSNDDGYEPHHINLRQVCSTRGWVY
jgi:hypothetical protein